MQPFAQGTLAYFTVFCLLITLLWNNMYPHNQQILPESPLLCPLSVPLCLPNVKLRKKCIGVNCPLLKN